MSSSTKPPVGKVWTTLSQRTDDEVKNHPALVLFENSTTLTKSLAVVALGTPGVGKSTFLNFLTGEDDLFKSSTGMKAMTQRIQKECIKLPRSLKELGFDQPRKLPDDLKDLKLFDTPGVPQYTDTDPETGKPSRATYFSTKLQCTEQYVPLLEDAFMESGGLIDAFLLVIDSSELDYTNRELERIQEALEILRIGYCNVIIIFTHGGEWGRSHKERQEKFYLKIKEEESERSCTYELVTRVNGRFILVESLIKEEGYQRKILLQLLKLIDRIHLESGPMKSERFKILSEEMVHLTKYQEEMKRIQEDSSKEKEKRDKLVQKEKEISLLEEECEHCQDEINVLMSKMCKVKHKDPCDLDFANLEDVSQTLKALSECENSNHLDSNVHVDNSQLEYAGARWEYLQKRAQLQQHQRTEKKLRQYCKYWKLSKGEWTDSGKVEECQTNPNLPREGQTDDSQETEESSDGTASEGGLPEFNNSEITENSHYLGEKHYLELNHEGGRFQLHPNKGPIKVEVRECQTSPQLPREGQTDDSQEMEELSDGNTSVGEFSEHNNSEIIRNTDSHPLGRDRDLADDDCCAELTVPADIVSSGDTVTLSYAILLTDPLKISGEHERVSVFLQLECAQAKSNSALLHKTVTVKLKHWANCSQATDLEVMNVNGDRICNCLPVSSYKNNMADRSVEFHVDVTVNNFCIIRKRKDGPVKSSYFATLIREPPTRNLQRFWLCVMYAVPSWRDAVFECCKKRHTLIKDLDPSDVQEISCSGNELSLSFKCDKGPGWRMKKRRHEIMLDTLELDPFVDPEVHKTMMSLDIYPPSIEFHIEYDPKSSLEPVYLPNEVTLESEDESSFISFPFPVHPELFPKPTEIQLLELFEQDWEKFASSLGCNPPILQKIQGQHDGNNSRDCALDFIRCWLNQKTGTGCYPRTWHGLVSAIKAGGDKALAEKLICIQRYLNSTPPHLPKDLREQCSLLGSLSSILLTHNGGEFKLHPFGLADEECCAELAAPMGVVDKGVEVSVHYAIFLSGPFKLPRKMKRASVVLYLQCPGIHNLKKSLTIRLRHWIQDRRRAPMYFLKAPVQIPAAFELFEDHCSQAMGDNCGSLDICDGCNLLCIAAENDKKNVKCYSILLQDRSRPPADEKQSKEHFRLCLVYAVPSMFQALREYCQKTAIAGRGYIVLGKDKEVDCRQLSLYFSHTKGDGWKIQRMGEVSVEKLQIKDESMKADHGCRPFIALGVYPPSAEFYVIYTPSLDDDCWGFRNDLKRIQCWLGKDKLRQTLTFPVYLKVPEFRVNPVCRPSTDSTDNDPEGGSDLGHVEADSESLDNENNDDDRTKLLENKDKSSMDPNNIM